ncbi:asparagine--tRNA ligase [Patescibacteria group bacterium]|nr:asparagine--tRNA ligase [Patescibacteria group bacterium]MBU1029469.1 asparagine--tRNA ligase [Patescibacteria group bacterium]MBU1916198.1 asparagine--tRNA ligase [Patescibacteria group bacterium]
MSTNIAEISAKSGQKVEIRGWCHNLRSSGKIAFLQLRDGTGRIQGVAVKNEVGEQVWALIQKLTIESSVIVRGLVRTDERAPSGFELTIEEVEPVQIAEEYPIGKKEHGPDFLLNNRHLWLRSERQASIMRVRDTIEFAFRDFMRQRGFVLADSPIFTPSACEGTTDLFEVKYFDDKAYLSQSGQLYQEATSAALGKTYCFGPTFRSEKSKTRRHLTEFWMLEAEASYMNWEENIQLQEDLVVFTVQQVLAQHECELTELGRDLTHLKNTIAGNFPRVSYTEAIERLQKLGSDVKAGEDLGGDDETILTKEFDRPVFIHHYPSAIKAFYMEPDPTDSTYALCNDLLAPEGYGEIIGGSQRVSDLSLLKQRISEHKLPEEAFGWYMDLRRYGSVPHAGFGIGLERTVAWICGLEHVRETIPFPRLLNRINP